MTLDLNEQEAFIVSLTLRKWGAHPIALFLQGRYSEPTWTIKAVKAEQKRLSIMADPRR